MDNILEIYHYTDIWLLIFCRIVAAVVTLPVVIETKLPAIALGGLTGVLTMIVFFTIPFEATYYAENVLTFGVIVLKEVVVGLIIGFAFGIFFQVYYFFGQLLSTQGGLGMSTIMDPNSFTQVPIIGKFYTLAFTVVFLASGGYHWFIKSLVETFYYIPVGKAVVNPEIMYSVLDAVILFFEMGFKLASPVVGVIVVVDCGLGILARVVPQMNMFVVGLPIKLIVLCLLMIALMEVIGSYNDLITKTIVSEFFNIIEGLVP
ncbi:flagellar biosynthetic protein FliR [Candidatus Epulonipiscium fishelsonii]|uniref:Flagellar biosynthetic protein FliR n=1 Tax=Candidatus Epulonipiscium fishelsonii TaxID=77094 RepID=A0ACC8XDE7_9FIRM|nr:flagellar biosynthetic protein FliR [Epulopiscium sp. SCG-B05WGA-EpuloA1]ONI40997.1 flagellar biosynthetic protein FliR [Epulopiscium sp. SCG-B11WGA-EpuloA1]